jgi:hypothetical protein
MMGSINSASTGRKSVAHFASTIVAGSLRLPVAAYHSAYPFAWISKPLADLLRLIAAAAASPSGYSAPVIAQVHGKEAW